MSFSGRPEEWYEDYGQGHPYLWREALNRILGTSGEGLWDWQRKLLMNYMTSSPIYGLKWNPQGDFAGRENAPYLSEMLSNIGGLLTAPSKEERITESGQQPSEEQVKMAQMPSEVKNLYPLIFGHETSQGAASLPPMALAELITQPEEAAPKLYSGFAKHLTGHYDPGSQFEFPGEWSQLSEPGKALLPQLYDWYRGGENEAAYAARRFPAGSQGGGLLKGSFGGGGLFGKLGTMGLENIMGGGFTDFLPNPTDVGWDWLSELYGMWG